MYGLNISKYDHVAMLFRILKAKGIFRPDASAQNDGVKHNALELEHMFVNRSIQTGRVASQNLYNRDAVVLTYARPV